jgi:hypothetical protein
MFKAHCYGSGRSIRQNSPCGLIALHFIWYVGRCWQKGLCHVGRPQFKYGGHLHPPIAGPLVGRRIVFDLVKQPLNKLTNTRLAARGRRLDQKIGSRPRNGVFEGSNQRARLDEVVNKGLTVRADDSGDDQWAGSPPKKARCRQLATEYLTVTDDGRSRPR